MIPPIEGFQCKDFMRQSTASDKQNPADATGGQACFCQGGVIGFRAHRRSIQRRRASAANVNPRPAKAIGNPKACIAAMVNPAAVMTINMSQTITRAGMAISCKRSCTPNLGVH